MADVALPIDDETQNEHTRCAQSGTARLVLCLSWLVLLLFLVVVVVFLYRLVSFPSPPPVQHMTTGYDRPEIACLHVPRAWLGLLSSTKILEGDQELPL